ncbi:MAG: substrate-binding domain-containing protein [Melioribacter sp.]|nr:substrate-binding domain-containing protein [Melioribacter sp.]
MIKNLGYILTLLVLVFSCEKETKETPTKGYLKCYVDESLFNIIKEEADLFMSLYPETKINIVAVKAREGIASILNNEIEMFISSRQLNDEEKHFIQVTKTDINLYKFCYDGIAVISNKNSKIDRVYLPELKEAMSSSNKKIKVVIPEKNSGVYEYLTSNLVKEEDLRNVIIVQSEFDVIKKIINSQNTIGLVGLNTLKGIENVKILKVGVWDNNVNGINYLLPYTGYLVNNTYPLYRTNYVLLREIGLGVASGFTSFLTSSEGQKLVMKNGLGPATVPVKLIQLN